MRKIALLIGMGEYSSSKLPNLPQAEQDSDDLYRVLVDPNLGEFSATNIELLKSPNKREMEQKIDWLFDDRKKDDLLLFYFAGHGVTDHKDHLYLTANDTSMKADDRLDTFSAIDSSYLLKYIEDSKSDRKVIILDACYSGAIAQGLIGRGTGGVKLKESLGGKGAAILASSSSTERTWDGMYTRCLVEGIETGAADINRDGWISLQDLHDYAVVRVADASSKMTMTPCFIPVKDQGHSIQLTKSPADPKLKYERLLQDEYSDENWGELSDFVRSLLLGKQQEWGISSASADEIEKQVLLYRSKLIEYEQGLTDAIQKQYPISAKFQAKLTEFQKYFKLRDEDIAEIHRRVLPNADSGESPKASAKFQGNLSREQYQFESAKLKIVGGKPQITKFTCEAEGFTHKFGNGETLGMVYIPPGKFLMGSPDGEGDADEKPQHQVTIAPFYMSKYPVTQAQWRSVASLPQEQRKLDSAPSHFRGDNRPVESVSWHDAVEFCARLSKSTGAVYRLPSEAEWEYACRAGTTTPFYFGDTITNELVNHKSSRGQTADVGIFPPNNFGLYDLHGNVWEWCADMWSDSYAGAPTDGSIWQKGNNSRSPLRGGSWYNVPDNCRSANRIIKTRDFASNRIGFRLVCE